MFSKIEDSNRVIPRMKGMRGNLIFQLGFAAFILFMFIGMLLPGELGDLFYQYEDLIYFPLFILFAASAIFFSVLGNRQINKKWETLASDYSLKFEKGKGLSYPVLSGSFRGHKVRVEVSSVKRGKNRTYFTNVFVTLPQSIGHSMAISRRGLLSGRQNLIGDEELDKKLEIATSSDALLRRILANHRLRRGLLELGEPKRLKNLALSSSSIHYIETGTISDTEYLAAVLRYLTDLANMIDHFDRMAF